MLKKQIAFLLTDYKSFNAVDNRGVAIQFVTEKLEILFEMEIELNSLPLFKKFCYCVVRIQEAMIFLALKIFVKNLE